MKKKLVSLLTVSAMTMAMLAGCGNSATEAPAAETATEAPAAETATEAPAAETAETAAEAVTETAGNADLADKKVGVCIYQFADNFMTLFRTEL
ncbi:MAG: galactose ABC transporter substrate-binding protein, partial [Butyrivibrio sp.]|nr:galactose ABC transporter substrate-binding protein [Butyrivibrio sp.]